MISAAQRRSLLPCKAFYFFHFAALSCLIPYLTIYYESCGISCRQIGILAALPSFVSLIAAPLWAGVGDRWGRHKQLVLFLLAASMAAVAGIASGRRFVTLMPIIALFALFLSPIMPMIDNTTLEVLDDKRLHYGRQRLWGTIGWGVMSPIIGFLIDRSQPMTGFFGYWTLAGAALATATFLPVAAPPAGRYWTNVGAMMGNRRWLHFLSVALFAGIGMVFVHAYLFLSLKNLGATRQLMGWAMFVATASELLIFLSSHRLLQIGPQRLFNLSMIALLIRLALTGAIHDPRWILPIQMLHGCTFGTMWLAGVAYANATAPRGLGATTQGVFLGTFLGLGGGLGSLLAGELMRDLGTSHMYLGAAAVVGIGFALYILAGLLAPGLGLSLRRPTGAAPGEGRNH